MKRSFRMITLKQILLQICPGHCSCRWIWKTHTFILRIRRGGISIQGPAVWAIPGSPHFYTMHECGSLPSAIDGNLHTQLPRRLAHSGPVAGSFNIAQDPPPQPLRLPRAQGQLCQEHTVTQQTSFFAGNSYGLSADDSNYLSRASHILAECQACQFFLPDIWGHHVLIHSDSRSVVSYINHQGGLVSKRLCMLANDLLVWAQDNLRSLKATHVPGKMNQGADLLSRNNVSSEEWMLHPLVVQRI